ncbi:MAG: sigma-70 family RNA polymerase sigma factor [Minisyncoccia bacterium]
MDYGVFEIRTEKGYTKSNALDCLGVFIRWERNKKWVLTLSMLDGEEKLIQDAVKEGDSSAFGQLYDHYQLMIYRFVFIKVGRREEAEDITHQVFLRAWQNVRNYRHRGYPFGSWLYRIARNQVIDHYRAQKEEVGLDLFDVDNEAFRTNQPNLSAQLDMERVMAMLHTLKPDYQDVIIFRFVEDLSIKEVAGAMQKTEGAIKLIQHRAIEELKKKLNSPEAEK